MVGLSVRLFAVIVVVALCNGIGMILESFMCALLVLRAFVRFSALTFHVWLFACCTTV